MFVIVSGLLVLLAWPGVLVAQGVPAAISSALAELEVRPHAEEEIWRNLRSGGLPLVENHPADETLRRVTFAIQAPAGAGALARAGRPMGDVVPPDTKSRLCGGVPTGEKTRKREVEAQIHATSAESHALQEENRVLRAASVQGLSRFSSSILFAYSHPTSLVDGKLINVGIRSLITRACQGFLQRVAFPLQFEYLFSFPGPLDPLVFEEQRRPGDFLSPSPLASASRRASSARAGEAERELVSGKKPLGDWLQEYW